jgi:hypothetical protein
VTVATTSDGERTLVPGNDFHDLGGILCRLGLDDAPRFLACTQRPNSRDAVRERGRPREVHLVPQSSISAQSATLLKYQLPRLNMMNALELGECEHATYAGLRRGSVDG